MAMADRNGLRLIGFLFATVTIAVMSTTVLLVKGHVSTQTISLRIPRLPCLCVERGIDAARVTTAGKKNSLPGGRPFNQIVSGDQLSSCRGPCRDHGHDLS
jgi:hypothetical protein